MDIKNNNHNEDKVKIGNTEIEYTKISTLDDYNSIEYKINNILKSNNKKECLLAIEKELNQTHENKERSLYIYFPLTTAFGYGILGLFLGMMISTEFKSGLYLLIYILVIVLYMFFLMLMLFKANKSLLKWTQRIIFLNKLIVIIDEYSDEK